MFEVRKLLSSFERIKSQVNSAVMMARRIHLFPFRTQKLSFVTPRVVRGTPLARVRKLFEIFTKKYCNVSKNCYNYTCCCGSSSVVEHHLAMVGVAGSNPVFRSKIEGSPSGESFFTGNSSVW